MATFSVTVPDDQVQLIAEAFAQQFQMETPLDLNNHPLSEPALTEARIEFARQQCIVFINGVVHMYLFRQNQEQAPAIPNEPLNLT